MAELYQFEPMLGPAEECSPGTVEWSKRISNRLQTGTRFISKHTAQHIGVTLKQIWEARPRPWEVWPEGKPFGTPDDYFRAITGFEWDALRASVAEFVSDHELRAGLARAQVEHRSQGTRSDQHPYQIRKSSERGGDGGTSAAYLLRRLARDHPEILGAYERGAITSVRAAAKAAGIIKDPSPFEQVQRLLPKLSESERDALRWLLEDIDRRTDAA